jgi:hypothetical protein
MGVEGQKLAFLKITAKAFLQRLLKLPVLGFTVRNMLNMDYLTTVSRLSRKSMNKG